jgi:hypothetical protein
VAVLLGDQRAIHSVDLGIRVLIQHHPLGRGSVGSLHPLQADGCRVNEEHRVAGHREMAALPGGSYCSPAVISKAPRLTAYHKSVATADVLQAARLIENCAGGLGLLA